MNKLCDPMNPALLHERSEFYLTLAQSFLTPQTEAHFRAIVDLLADDLADLDRSLNYGLAAPLDALCGSLSELSGPEQLLQVYSRMFLQPPREVNLNVCFALDGAMMGGTVTEIEQFYQHYGVERGDHFKDLPDHVSVQLEFVSYLYGRAAEGLENNRPDPEAEKAAQHFLYAFVRRWLPHFESGIAKAGRHLELQSNPYLPLAQILALAVAKDALAHQEWLKPKKQSELAMDKARQTYASRGVTSEDMADIERKLREHGLSTDHLKVALEDRNAAMGLSAKSPPDPRRK